MIIRPYITADKEGCVAAFKSNMPKYFAPHELTDFEEWLDKQHDTETVGGAKQFFVVDLDGKIIACGGYYVHPETKEARMSWGLVHHDFHKQGIGKMFLKYRITAIKAQFPGCVVAVDTSQHSYPFFEKSGFKTIKVTDDFYAPGLDRYDMVLETQP